MGAKNHNRGGIKAAAKSTSSKEKKMSNIDSTSSNDHSNSPHADRIGDAANQLAAAAAAPAGTESGTETLNDVLLGSSVLPALIKIGEDEVQLGAVVSGAYQLSNLSVAGWNALSEEEREAKLQAYIDAWRTSLTSTDLISDPSIAQAQAGEMQDGTSSAGVSNEAAGVYAIEGSISDASSSPEAKYQAKFTEPTVALDVAGAVQNQPAAVSAALNPTAVATATATSTTEPQEELPVSANEDIPQLPEGKFSLNAQLVLSTVVEYVTTMHPKRPVEPAKMLRQQTALYRALTTAINRLEAEEFTTVWGWLLQQFSLYRKGVFAERYVFRGFEDIALPESDRKAFQRLLNLIVLTADPKSRPIALRQVDMGKTLELGVTEPGRQRLHAFYNV